MWSYNFWIYRSYNPFTLSIKTIHIHHSHSAELELDIEDIVLSSYTSSSSKPHSVSTHLSSPIPLGRTRLGARSKACATFSRNRVLILLSTSRNGDIVWNKPWRKSVGPYRQHPRLPGQDRDVRPGSNITIWLSGESESGEIKPAGWQRTTSARVFVISKNLNNYKTSQPKNAVVTTTGTYLPWGENTYLISPQG